MMGKRWLFRRLVLMSLLSTWFITLVTLGNYITKLFTQDKSEIDAMDRNQADIQQLLQRQAEESMIEENENNMYNTVKYMYNHSNQAGDRPDIFNNIRRLRPGEFGRPVFIDEKKLSQEDLIRYRKGWAEHGFNEYVSDLISLQRSLPDARNKECKYLVYAENLPDVSVIITFYNEAWSTLLRSIYSVLNRTPPHLLKQIILVDDFSDHPHLGRPLDSFIWRFKKVSLVRNVKREGLIRARLRGYSLATASVLVFLDSHIECTRGWLEPLLDRIAKDRTTVVTPIIDAIEETDFRYRFHRNDSPQVGGFNWNLVFTWHYVPRSDRQKPGYKEYLPVRSPTMAGGLFAIDRSFFSQIGTYDRGMDLWGGENLELSFRVWMCGGSIETVPCSRIGHVFREVMPYQVDGVIDSIRRNRVRVAEVWMDDYKKYYYDKLETKTVEYGNIMDRKLIRQMLKCKSFNWYLKRVYPEMYVPGESNASGEIRNKLIDVCIDGPGFHRHVNISLKIKRCHGNGDNQYWVLTYSGRIRRDSTCVEYDEESSKVTTAACNEDNARQDWQYQNVIDTASAN